MYVLVFFIIKKSWVVLPSPPQKFYYLHIQGGYRGVGRNVAPPPLRFQKSSSIALKGKKTASAKQESQSKISSSVRLLVPKSGLLSSEINLAPPSLKSCIRPCAYQARSQGGCRGIGAPLFLLKGGCNDEFSPLPPSRPYWCLNVNK